ncbi:MAG: helix-turn-helix domain-containing protein, partial [Nitriliruptorales bacterium]
AWRGHDDLEGNARYFGWRDDDLAASWERLNARGWFSDRELTDEGRETRVEIETQTNVLASQPWAAVSEDDRQRTVEFLVEAGETVRGQS